MTTINTFEDLLQALEQNPTLREAMRRHIMTEEVMQLPARVFRLEELVARIATQLEELTNVLTRFTEQTNQRLDKVETDVTELKEGQARLEAGQARLETDVAGLKEGQARLEARTERLEAGQARLETDVTSLKEGQARLEDSQARLETRMDRLETGQIRMSGQLSHLLGSDYQSHVARLARRWLKRHFQITNADILWVSTTSEKQDLLDLLDQAVESGAISDHESEDMERTDIVIRGSYPDGNPAHVVIEASLTVQESDIRRAADRAAILEKAVGGPTRAVVIGESIAGTDQELADREQVQFIQMMQHGSTA